MSRSTFATLLHPSIRSTSLVRTQDSRHVSHPLSFLRHLSFRLSYPILQTASLALPVSRPRQLSRPDKAFRRSSTTLRLRSKRLLLNLPLGHDDLRVIPNRSHVDLTSVSRHVRHLVQRFSGDLADGPHHKRVSLRNAINVSSPACLLGLTIGLSAFLHSALLVPLPPTGKEHGRGGRDLPGVFNGVGEGSGSSAESSAFEFETSVGCSWTEVKDAGEGHELVTLIERDS